MTIAGMASGFTALFGAPLGGSLFALEILHHKHVVEYYSGHDPCICVQLHLVCGFCPDYQDRIGAKLEHPSIQRVKCQ